MCIFRKLMVGTALVAITASTQCLVAEQNRHTDEEAIERGRYLTMIAGCNDCHTPGYRESGGKVPQNKWLIGSNFGWRGPWGTTYPPNLRLYLQRIPEEKWVTIAHTTQYRPPMPWFDLRDMSEEDLRAIYRFVTYLGPAGEPAPAYLPPDQEPKGPYVQFPQPPK
jgi:mono/diheme cytochrome c family protein